MYEHVIVPVDLSHHEPEDQVMAVANRILTVGGKLTLLHVLEPLSPSYTLVGLEVPKIRAKAEERVLLQLQEVVAKRKLPADTDVRVEYGRAARLICDSVTDADRQAIVMASHNPMFMDFLLGSVASQVVKHAKCSVFIVRHSTVD